jgi:hypothetical protein
MPSATSGPQLVLKQAEDLCSHLGELFILNHSIFWAKARIYAFELAGHNRTAIRDDSEHRSPIECLPIRRGDTAHHAE